MARFERAGEHVELVREGRTILEGTAHGGARRELADERAAAIAYYTRIAEILSEGHVRKTPFVDDLLPIDDGPTELVAAIDAGDPDALAVYTDALLERGDPRGELAALRAAATPHEKQIASLERTRRLELYGPLCALGRAWRDQMTFVWRRGWIDEVMFHEADGARPNDTEVMQHGLHAPMARFARWLAVDTWYSTPIWEGLAGCSCLARIRGLRSSAVTQCFGVMLDALPALEELEILEPDRMPTGGHPGVRRIRLTIDQGPIELPGPWPALRRVELACASELGVLRGVLSLAECAAAAGVRELVIEAPAFPEHLRARIAEQPFVQRLARLELRPRG